MKERQDLLCPQIFLLEELSLAWRSLLQVLDGEIGSG